MKKKIITDPMGQWKHPGENTRIPSDKITMKGVNYPVLGVSNNGQKKMMQPGQEYTFPGADYVDEFPQLRRGGTKGLIPMPEPSKKGLASKKYSRSLEATNKLFTENKLFKKPKSKKNKVFDPNAKYYQKGGFIDVELDDKEIAQYVKGGYVVEDISVAPLKRAQSGLEQVPPKEELMQAPRASIKTDPNLDREAIIGEKIANYSPTEASYKSMDRPKSNFVPSEDASPEFINKLKSSGYYPVKSESGDYEVFSNKDISDLIYQKGMSPGELSEKLKLGDSKEIEKQFKPVYDNAGGIHAKRNKEKIDNLIKSGMSKEQAISTLAEQGEGDIQGLTSKYGNYTDATYQKQKAEADALNTKKGDDQSPYQKEMFARINANQEAEDAKVNAAAENVDWSRSLTPSETTNRTAGPIYNPLTKSLENKSSAYDVNEEAELDFESAGKQKELLNKQSALAKELLNNKDLTEDQKKYYLNSEAAFDDLYKRHNEWKDSSTTGQSYTTASGQSIPQVGKSLNFDFTPGNEKGWTSTTKESAPSDRVDMLDKEWMKGIYGAVALPGAASAVSTILKAAPAAAPWLSASNALTAKGIYDTATEYAPNVYSAVKEANTNGEGWTNDLISKAAYNTTKGLLSGVVPLSSRLKNLSTLKKAKTAFSVVDNGIPAVSGSKDPLKHIKFLNSVEGLSKIVKKSGGPTKNYVESELSQKEINDLIAQGYIIEELD